MVGDVTSGTSNLGANMLYGLQMLMEVMKRK